MVEFSVTSEGVCTLNTSRGEQVLAGNIFGGDFGSIEPGSSMTVSLVWPTVVSKDGSLKGNIVEYLSSICYTYSPFIIALVAVPLP